MAVQIQLPSAIRKQLSQTAGKGVFNVKNPSDWFGADLAKLGNFFIRTKSGDEVKGVIIRVHETSRQQCTVFVDFLEEENNENILENLKIGVLEFVSSGFKIITTFQIITAVPDTLLKQSVIKLDIKDIIVSLEIYSIILPEDSGLYISFRINRDWFVSDLTTLSLTHMELSEALDQKLIGRGIYVEKSTLKRQDTHSFIPIKLFMMPDTNNKVNAQIRKISQVGLKQIAAMIDNLWLSQAQQTYKARNKILVEKNEGEPEEETIEDESFEKIESNFEPKLLLLSKDEHLLKRFEAVGKVELHSAEDIKALMNTIRDNPVDAIFADAGLGSKTAFNLAVEMRFEKALKSIPTFWISKDYKDMELAEIQQFMESGAYECLSRGMSPSKIFDRLKWAIINNAIGSGEKVLLFGHDKKSNYQIGISLLSEELEIYQDSVLSNPVEALNRIDPKWIIINSKGMGKNYKSILNSSIFWTKKKGEASHVFLLAESMLQAEEEQKLAKAGIGDIFVYDSNIKSIAAKIIVRMDNIDEFVFEPISSAVITSPAVQRKMREQIGKRN